MEARFTHRHLVENYPAIASQKAYSSRSCQLYRREIPLKRKPDLSEVSLKHCGRCHFEIAGKSLHTNQPMRFNFGRDAVPRVEIIRNLNLLVVWYPSSGGSRSSHLVAGELPTAYWRDRASGAGHLMPEDLPARSLSLEAEIFRHGATESIWGEPKSLQCCRLNGITLGVQGESRQ